MYIYIYINTHICIYTHNIFVYVYISPSAESALRGTCAYHTTLCYIKPQHDIIKTDNTFNTTDNQYFTRIISNTSNIANVITRHSHNNYEHNVIKKVSRHTTV